MSEAAANWSRMDYSHYETCTRTLNKLVAPSGEVLFKSISNPIDLGDGDTDGC